MVVQRMQRYDEVVKLREKGLTYMEIGRRLGVSKERVRQILKGNPRPRSTGRGSKIMLAVGEVARLLGVHENTVRRWSESGVLRPYRINDRGDRRYRREDIENFLKHSTLVKKKRNPGCDFGIGTVADCADENGGSSRVPAAG